MKIAVHIWASLLLVAFVWSAVLYLVRVVAKNRKQETGFLYGIFGLILYVIAFADRLPGSPTDVRRVLLILPGTNESKITFTSSWILLLLISILYVARILVYMELIPTRGMTKDELREFLNDVVAPMLAFITLALCIVQSIWGIYAWNWPWAIVIFALAFALYFFRAGEYLLEFVRYLRKFLYHLPIIIIEAAVFIESLRPLSPETAGLDAWIATAEDREDLTKAQRMRLQRAKERLEEKRSKREAKRKRREAKRKGAAS